MFRFSFLAALLMLISAASPARADALLTDVDAIIARHIDARGGENRIRAIRSLVFDRGRYEEGEYSDDQAVMMLMRPYLKLVGHPERNPQFMEGYDGAAWEWFADPGLVVRTVATASAALRHFADVEGPFLDYRSKGHRAELIGTPDVAGRPTYQIRLTMMDGYASDNFIDQQNFLIVASRHVAQVHAFGAEVASETRFSDYRPVAGVMFPFRGEEVDIATGRTMNSMQWGSIEANVDIPLGWFSPPEFERNRIQTFMDQLYVQRTDPQAVLWTYHHFRRAYPQEDTRNASQVIGYQMLKMNSVDSAIALLERNAADYPDAADSAFGLGRAFATARREAEARAEFERALRLEPGHVRATRALAELNGPSRD